MVTFHSKMLWYTISVSQRLAQSLEWVVCGIQELVTSENWGEQRRGVEGRRVLAPGCPCPLSSSLGGWGWGMRHWLRFWAGCSCVGSGHSFPHVAPLGEGGGRELGLSGGNTPYSSRRGVTAPAGKRLNPGSVLLRPLTFDFCMTLSLSVNSTQVSTFTFLFNLPPK